MRHHEGMPLALPARRPAVDRGVELRLGVEGGPADGAEVVVETVNGQPPVVQQLAGARYVLRWHGVSPHPDADWHYCHVG